ncbi:MAG TPA: hypothetical protein P5186_06705 [Candidatus Paceibacterota bacterium]|nr:hypothetical protein [Verrucomicrobiota bacterium]HRY47719.1 hypothetical protein [Candidatus Paceibacterota bacterium]HSA02480.1 hypothetical protein [Candidatus Paceibacterota bacterium]
MKNALIILSIFCTMLLASSYLHRGKARQQAEESAREIVTLSNKVVELETRLVMNQALAVDAQTNLQVRIEKCTKETAAFSNRLAQVSKLFHAAQKESQAVHAELESKALRLNEVEGELDNSSRRLEHLRLLETNLIELKASLLSVTAQRDHALQESRSVQVEKNEIEHQFNDLNALRLQTKKLEEQARLNRRVARGISADQYNRQAPLTLESNGTVKPLPPVSPLSETR